MMSHIGIWPRTDATRCAQTVATQPLSAPGSACIKNLATSQAVCVPYVSSNAQLIRNSDALPAVTRLNRPRDGDEPGKFQRPGIERRRGFAAQPSIARFDQAVGKVGD